MTFPSQPSGRSIQRLPLTKQLNLGVLDNPLEIQNDGKLPIVQKDKLYTSGSQPKLYITCYIYQISVSKKGHDPNLSLPAQSKFHYYPYICHLSSHIINIFNIAQ